MDEAAQTKLAELANTKMTLADWRLALGHSFQDVQPQLRICTGEIAGSYPDPQTGRRLKVKWRGEKLVGFPVGDEDRDVEDLELSPDDVALWRLPENGLTPKTSVLPPATELADPEQLSFCTLRNRGCKPRKRGSGTRNQQRWAIKYTGEEFDLQDTIGTEYLVVLLRNPGKEYRADELINAVVGGGIGHKSKDAVSDLTEDSEGEIAAALRWQPDAADARMDRKGIEDLTKKAKALQQMIAEGANDPALAGEVQQAEEQLAAINAYLVKNTKLSGGKVIARHFESGTFRDQANLISKHICGVLRHVRAHDEELGRHLSNKLTLIFGSKNLYTGTGTTPWRVTGL